MSFHFVTQSGNSRQTIKNESAITHRAFMGQQEPDRPPEEIRKESPVTGPGDMATRWEGVRHLHSDLETHIWL